MSYTSMSTPQVLDMLRITSGRISFPGRNKSFPTNEEIYCTKEKLGNILHAKFSYAVSQKILYSVLYVTPTVTSKIMQMAIKA